MWCETAACTGVIMATLPLYQTLLVSAATCSSTQQSLGEKRMLNQESAIHSARIDYTSYCPHTTGECSIRASSRHYRMLDQGLANLSYALTLLYKKL